MSYGYNSIVAFSKSEAGIDDFAADLLRRLIDIRDTSEVGEDGCIHLGTTKTGPCYRKSNVQSYLYVIASVALSLRRYPLLMACTQQHALLNTVRR
jgi:hypothetical protein